jgi:hypothetical protein
MSNFFNLGGYEASTEIAITRGNVIIVGTITDDNKTYLKTAELITEDGATKLKLTGKKLGLPHWNCLIRQVRN